MAILQRYILVELLRAFILALAALTAIFVLIGLVQQATHEGLSPLQVLSLIPYVIPASLPFSIPATLLLAVTMVYGRLAADNEIMAAKAAGIHLLYLVVPALLLGVILSFFTFYLYDRVIPVANFRLRTAFLDNAEEVVYAVLRREKMIKGGGNPPYEMYVQNVVGKTLRNVMVKRSGTSGGPDLVISAPEARLEFDIPKKVVNVHLREPQVWSGNVRIDDKRESVFPIPLADAEHANKAVREMTLQEITAYKAKLADAHERACAMWAFYASASIAGGDLKQARWSSLVDLIDKQKSVRRELRRLDCEPHLRGAVSFGCLFFVLLGCPMAILFQRGDYLSAFISCFLPIMALYYPLMMLGLNLGKEGTAWPIALWLGNALLAMLGAMVFRPVIRH